MKKIEEKDADFVKVTKLVFGFRENPEFLFRTLRFLDDIRISTMNYAIHERQKVFDKIDNSFYYFIANNLFNNLTFTNSKDDEFLSVIFRLLKEQINEKNNFLDEDSVLSNIFKAMLIQIDMKEKFKVILQEILFKMEELSDEEWLLDIHDINKFIYELNIGKKYLITEKVRNLFLKKNNDSKKILKNDEKLFRKFTNFKLKDSIEEFDEEKYGNMRGFVGKVKRLFLRKNEGKIENEEPKYDIRNFYEEIKNSSNQKLAIDVYRHYFLIVRKILHITIDTLISKINYIPYIVRCICKMIEILGRNSFNSKDTSNFDILSLIGKYFFNNIIKLFLYDERFIVMLDFYPSSLYAKNNLNLMKTIISFLQNGDLFSLNNHPNLIPFNALFLNELLPKLYNFYKSLTNIPFSPYLEELISGKIKEYDFSYNFFERNPDDIFRNMSICFNINNYYSFLTLFKSYTNDSRDRKEFYKRGDKNCINNMRQYFGSSSDYKDLNTFTKNNQNKDPNIFHLYYKNISKDFDLGNEKNDSQIVFYIPEKNLQEIESQEDFRKNEIIKMKNRLCLLLYKIGDLEEENILDEDKKDLYNMIKKVISISKDEVIGKTLQILIDKIIFKDKENNDFHYTFFKDLEEGIQKYSDELEDSYSKMNKANENLRSIILNINIINKNNDLLLLYNTYLDLEKTLEENKFYQTDKETSNNFTQFLEYFSTIKDDKLETFYAQKIVDSFLIENTDFGKGMDNNPETVNILHNYIINASEGKEQYMNVVSDFISSRVYDMLIYKKPDLDDIKLYKYLIGNKNNFEEFKDTIEPDHKTLRIMISLLKKFIKFRGVYQKILSLNENLMMFQNHHNFIKGKNDMLERDGIINYFTYVINKTYFNSYIRKAKYCLLFAVGQGNTESLNGALSFMITHI